MSIRLRIALLVLSVFLSLAAIGGFAIHRSQLSAREVRNVTTGVVPDAIESIELMGQLKDVQIATLAMVNETEPAAIEKRRREIADRKARLQASLQTLATHAKSEAEKGLVAQAMDGVTSYFQSIDDTAQLALAGQHEIAQANLAGTVDQYLREEGEIMQTLQVERTRTKDEAIASLNTLQGRTTATLGVATLLTVLASAVIGWLLQRQVVRPIAAMERRMTDIATHHDYSLRMPVERQDEIGRSIVAFNTMLAKIEESAAEVQAKNANIRALLQAIPEGILTLEAGGVIQPEYSAHLNLILGPQNHAGCSVMDVLFAASPLSDDERAALAAAIDASIGEDEMNFAFNAHLLPAEVCWQPAGASAAKILELHWEPMADGQGVVQRLLLTLRDVTEMRSLAQAAAQQARELTMISELLALPAGKFASFLAQTLPDLDRMQALLAPALNAEPDDGGLLAQLFRLMHTVKGNARTLGLKTLANVAHQAEDSYDRWRRGEAEMDVAQARSELGEVRALAEAYRHLHDDTLGRNAAASASTLSEHDVAQLGALTRQARGHASPQAQDALDEVLEILARAEAVSLDELLAPIERGCEALAEELGKPVPAFEHTGTALRLRPSAQKVLTGAFNHLLRNAMDHGLETAAQREAAHKPAQGRIRLEASLAADGLQLTLADDGRGLNLARIRSRALSLGLLNEQDAASAETLAQLIFAPGFSTAERVTDISGRGVGMDAVRADVEALGGSIRLVLGQTSGDFAPFSTRISLPADQAWAPMTPAAPSAPRADAEHALQSEQTGEHHVV
ncbi:Hpt domain-containing protein [Ideonella sp. B508-1]|uniref:Hpt domain-containing protein n=1 Tax=Ideonella sp. B508-1 TaxID=137716 RepID=UPI00034688AC|nr:Hpt domain-containing protein [Ideonella sp. B508-1]